MSKLIQTSLDSWLSSYMTVEFSDLKVLPVELEVMILRDALDMIYTVPQEKKRLRAMKQFTLKILLNQCRLFVHLYNNQLSDFTMVRVQKVTGPYIVEKVVYLKWLDSENGIFKSDEMVAHAPSIWFNGTYGSIRDTIECFDITTGRDEQGNIAQATPTQLEKYTIHELGKQFFIRKGIKPNSLGIYPTIRLHNESYPYFTGYQ